MLASPRAGPMIKSTGDPFHDGDWNFADAPSTLYSFVTEPWGHFNRLCDVSSIWAFSATFLDPSACCRQDALQKFFHNFGDQSCKANLDIAKVRSILSSSRAERWTQQSEESDVERQAPIRLLKMRFFISLHPS